MKKIFAVIVLSVLPLWASPKDSVELSHAAVAVEVGALYLLDDSKEALDDTYYVLSEFEYSYFRRLTGVVQFGYAYLSTKGDLDYPGIHQVNGRVGLDYSLPFVEPVAVGGGFSCIWMRADDDGGDASASTLDDNETEFGAYVRLNLPILNFGNWRVGAKVYYENLWTEPETSETAWFGFYVQRHLW